MAVGDGYSAGGSRQAAVIILSRRQIPHTHNSLPRFHDVLMVQGFYFSAAEIAPHQGFHLDVAAISWWISSQSKRVIGAM